MTGMYTRKPCVHFTENGTQLPDQLTFKPYAGSIQGEGIDSFPPVLYQSRKGHRMTAKTFKLPEPLTDADKTFMARITAEKNKRDNVIRVNGRQVIVVKRSLD